MTNMLSGPSCAGMAAAEDVLAWLARCSSSLKPGGLIVVKENLTSGVNRFAIDEVWTASSRAAEPTPNDKCVQRVADWGCTCLHGSANVIPYALQLSLRLYDGD